MLRKLVWEIRADADRYLHGADHPWYLVVLSRQGLWIMLQHRFSRWVRCQTARWDFVVPDDHGRACRGP
jgi:hypothetical protein